jgi:hypothetical protein
MSLHSEDSEPSPTRPRFQPDVHQEIPEELMSTNLLSEDRHPYLSNFLESFTTIDTNPVGQTSALHTTAPPPISTTTPTARMSSFPPYPRTPEMMPLIGQKGAPSKFTGKYEDVKPFIEHYNQLASTYGLTDLQKCRKVTIYCSRSVIDLLEALASYKSGNWTQLEKDFLRYFDADRVEIRWLPGNLDDLTKKWRECKIENLTRWKKYECQFVTIAGWLEQAGKITVTEKS